MKTPSRKRPRFQNAVCDIFNCTCVLQEDNLVTRVVTDLPIKTRLHLTITRPSRGYIWTDVEEHITIQPMGELSGIEFIRSIDELDKCGLNKYRYWKGRWPSEIKGVPEDMFEVRVVLNALDHQFGVCNRELSGSQIEIRKDGNWIERDTVIAAPLPKWITDTLP